MEEPHTPSPCFCRAPRKGFMIYEKHIHPLRCKQLRPRKVQANQEPNHVGKTQRRTLGIAQGRCFRMERMMRVFRVQRVHREYLVRVFTCASCKNTGAKQRTSI